MVGAVPHDVGSPSEDPLFRTNIYNFQVFIIIILIIFDYYLLLLY